MKPIENRVVINERDGYLSIYMTRTRANGRPYLYALHLSPAEQANGRRYVADRIRHARRNLRQAVELADSVTIREHSHEGGT